MDILDLSYRFGAALAIGLLIGLQREHSYLQGDGTDSLFAGSRTFPLLALAGCLAAYVGDQAGSVGVLLVTSAVIGVLIAVAYVVRARHGDIGMTTEAAGVVVFLIGALCYFDQLTLAVAVGVATTVLLSVKLEMRRFVQRVTREDLYATLKFAVITAIILPVLSDEPLGPAPFDVLRPYQIWLMVVLISAIGFLGYVLIKVVGTRRGIGLTGFLGGLVSSTAVTLSFAQKSRERESLAQPFALAIIVAWTMMFARVLVEVGVVNPRLLTALWKPLGIAGLAGLAYCVWLYRASGSREQDETTFANPFELGPAIQFGLLFGIILLIQRVAQIYLGDQGLYLSSILAGFTDVDAVTLSIAQLSKADGSVSLPVGARAIVLAALANTVVKGGIVVVSGGLAMRKVIMPGILLILVAGVVSAVLLTG